MNSQLVSCIRFATIQLGQYPEVLIQTLAIDSGCPVALFYI